MKNNGKNESRHTVERIFIAKELFHKKQAKLGFEEKIKILTRLQAIANEISPLRRGKKKTVWKV